MRLRGRVNRTRSAEKNRALLFGPSSESTNERLRFNPPGIG